jgi:hypothetical protein
MRMRHLYEFLLLFILGLWLVSSPYVVGFTDVYGAYWNAVGVGAIVTLLSLGGLYADRDEWAGRHRPAHPQRA